jgi:tetratricopeptide (TPR) repeat protein
LLLPLLLLISNLRPQASARAVELFQSGAQHEAVALLEKELVERPDDGGLRGTLVECLMLRHRYRRALEVMRPDGGGASRGKALFLLARYDEALTFLDAGDPDEVLMLVDALEALGRMGESDQAVDRAREVLGEGHASVSILTGRRAARAGKHDAAILAYRRALAIDPVSQEALFGLGTSLVRSGARDEGRGVLEEHRRILPLLDRLEFAERSLQLNPAHAPNQAAVGDIQRVLGRERQAEASYRRALEIATDDQLAPIVLRFSRFKVENDNDLDAAIELLRRGERRCGDVRLIVRQGDLFLSHERFEEAEAAFERALTLRPGAPAILERIRKLKTQR